MVYDAKGNLVDRLPNGAWGVIDTADRSVKATYWSRKDAHEAADRLGGPPRYRVFIDICPPPDTIGEKLETEQVEVERDTPAGFGIPSGALLIGPFPVGSEVEAMMREQMATPEGYKTFVAQIAGSCPEQLIEPTIALIDVLHRTLEKPEGVDAFRSVLMDLKADFETRVKALRDVAVDAAKSDNSIN